jgi:hypothetical protein
MQIAPVTGKISKKTNALGYDAVRRTTAAQLNGPST